jgi:hypothetical protein
MTTSGKWRGCYLFLVLRCKFLAIFQSLMRRCSQYTRIMRPNTPHLVYTMESAICHGGHFYCMSTIRDSIFGIFHTFSASSLLTNTEHTKDARLLLRRIVTYIHYVFVRREFDTSQSAMPTPHVPDVSTFEGTIDLFMLCIVMELGDLINPRAYRRETNPGHHDLLFTIHVRGLARDLLDWWQAHYQFVSEDGTQRVAGWELFHQLLLHQVRTLVIYKGLAERSGIDSDEPECKASAFATWLVKYHGKRLGFSKSTLSDWVSEHQQDWPSMSFAWPGEIYAVEPRTPPYSFKASKSPPCSRVFLPY